MLTLQALGRDRIGGAPDRGGTASFGVGDAQLNHKDLQTVQNQPHAVIGPSQVTGLSVNY